MLSPPKTLEAGNLGGVYELFEIPGRIKFKKW